jgi:arylsulfatase A-like enzyme
MPVVSKLADEGVRFLHNHAVFPTVTRGNSASLVTGVTPGKHGLTANKSIFPEYSSTEVVDALVPKLPEINRITGGGLLLVPTIGELISQRDLKWVSVVGGTSGNAYVQHPNASDFGDVVIHPEFTNPPDHHATIIGKLGEWPPKEAPARELVERTADVAIEYALAELNPDVLLVWFPEPDTSQHAFGVDSPEAQDMYALADSQLGRIMSAISGQAEAPDVFVVSDHGYSTIDSVIDIQAELAGAGFDLAPRAGQGENSVVVAENGGSVLLYLPGSNPERRGRLLSWLSDQPWVDAIATKGSGSDHSEFATMSEIGLDGPRAPDIAIAMRSESTGLPAPLSRAGAVAGGKIGAGSHGGGSAAELHNTLIASGPSFVSGLRSNLATGNIDIAPTVLNLLRIPVPGHMEGRVLSEALRDRGVDARKNSQQSTRQAERAAITTVIVGNTVYLCQLG